MNPLTDQPVMTLEETISNLRLCLQAGVTSFGGSSLIRKKEVGEILTSTLHHLEAGRNLREAAVEAGIGLGAYKASYTPEICESLNAQLCKGHDLIMEALSIVPTAQDVKEEPC